MGRRRALTDDKRKIIAPKRTDEELFEKFFHDCAIRNLRDSPIEFYQRHQQKQHLNNQQDEQDAKPLP
jgi:integrase/recombinase XerD